ncbi:MAG: hypothetical protein ACKVIH_13180, partial [Burkholderiales bacterium]
IVPTLTCGLVRANFSFAILLISKEQAREQVLRLHQIADFFATGSEGHLIADAATLTVAD